MHPIILIVPPYAENSNGIKSMHKICHTINQVGGDARLAFLNGNIVLRNEPSWVNPALNTPALQEEDRILLQTEIVIYPEIVPGNPCCASKVVRYLGNKDGLLTGRKMNENPNDFLLAHSKVIEPKAHCVLFNAEVNPVFNKDYIRDEKNVICDVRILHERRNIDATYIGKGHLYGDCPAMPQTILIERNWPRGTQQLAYLLRRTRLFYTYDSFTQTNIDAIMCGAMPYFLRYDPWTEMEIDGGELGVIPRWNCNNGSNFKNERITLINRISELNATWDERVKGFLDQVQAYFSV